MTKRTARFALLASFGVYLLPVVGPHFVSLWGVVLWRELTHGERPAGWLATDLALALGLQLAAALVLYVVLRRGSVWRFAWLLVAVPVLFVILESAYMIVIPTAFLIDEDSSQELREWEMACTIPEARIVPVRFGAELALERSQVVWIARGPKLSRTGLLSMPECDIRDIRLDSPHAGGGLQWVTADGVALFTRWDPVAAERSYWYLSRDGQERELQPPPELRYWLPALSTDGRTLAWISRDSRVAGRPRQTLVLRDIAGTESRIALPETISGSFELLSFETEPPRLTLSTSGGEVLVLDRGGHPVWGPDRLDGIGHVSQNLRRLNDGWVAWDLYREEGPYRVVWSLPAGKFRYEVPRGRSITSVAVHPAGSLIGVSVSPAYNIGSVRDAVFVLRVEDGQEVYRRNLPSYSRSEIAFLGAHFFAMNIYSDGQSVIEILRVSLED